MAICGALVSGMAFADGPGPPATSQPAPPAGAPAGPPPADEGAHASRCVPDPDTAELAVKLAFSDLVNIHRGRIPGPSGRQLVDDKIDELLAKTLDLDRFSASALSPMWNGLEPQRQKLWQDQLLVGLRGHYLRRLTEDASPLGQRLDIDRAEVDCDHATVDMTLGKRNGRHRTDLSLQLAWTGSRWRAFDVSVDGVSLLETWRNRFRQLFRDGGVAAVDEHLRQLAERNRDPDGLR
ncbi:MAG: ABC transporter substrate-binding protein [Myxococcota bacterium]